MSPYGIDPAEVIIEFCQTPRTIREIFQEFNYDRAAIKFLCRQLVKFGHLKIIGKNHIGLDRYQATTPPRGTSRTLTPEDIRERRTRSRRIVFLGDSGVGKTALLRGFVDKSYDADTTKVTGVHFHTKTVIHMNQRCSFSIWELSGKRNLAQIGRHHCTSAAGAFFVFDTTRPKTLESLDRWITALDFETGKVPIVIVENKIDLRSQISKSSIDSCIKKYGVEHIRKNAMDEADTLEEAFKKMVLQIMERKGVP